MSRTTQSKADRFAYLAQERAIARQAREWCYAEANEALSRGDLAAHAKLCQEAEGYSTYIESFIEEHDRLYVELF